MKLYRKTLSIIVTAPVAAGIILLSSPVAMADTCDDGLVLGLGGKSVCLGDSNNKGTTPESTVAPAPHNTGTTTAPIAPAAQSPSTPSVTVTQTQVVVVPVEVPVVAAPVQSDAPSPLAVETQPATTPAPAAPTAVVTPSMSESATAAPLALENAASGSTLPLGTIGGSVSLFSLAVLITMLIIAKRKKLFPFEGRHK